MQLWSKWESTMARMQRVSSYIPITWLREWDAKTFICPIFNEIQIVQKSIMVTSFHTGVMVPRRSQSDKLKIAHFGPSCEYGNLLLTRLGLFTDFKEFFENFSNFSNCMSQCPGILIVREPVTSKSLSSRNWKFVYVNR